MSPTASVLAAAQERLSAVDNIGRTLIVRRLNALDKLRLLKAAGPALSENQAWLGVAMLAASVTEIDGVPVPMPVTEQQIEVLVGRLGDPGLDGIAAALAGAESGTETNVGNSPGILA
jgi:protein gp37